MPGAYLHGFDETTGAKVMCRVTADGKLIVNAANILENPPTEDQGLKAPTSEWAYDHWKNVNAHHTPVAAGDLNHQDLANRGADDHHTKYTDDNSRAAIGGILTNIGRLTGDLMCMCKKLTYLQAFRLRWATGQTKYCLIQATSNSPDLRFQGNESGVGAINTNLRIWYAAAYRVVIHAGIMQNYMQLYMDNPPTENSNNTVPTSEWAYDHWKDAAAHHAKYTDAEALAAPSGSIDTLTTGTYYDYDVTGVAIMELNPVGGDITLGGFSNGYEGQIIWFIRQHSDNSIIIDHNSAHIDVDQQIITKTATDETQAAGGFGGFRMIFHDGYWWVDHEIT